MAEENEAQGQQIDQESIDALHTRLDEIEKKLDKCNEDLRGIAAFFFFVVLMYATGLSLTLALIAGMGLTIVYVAYVDFRTIRRNKRKRK